MATAGDIIKRSLRLIGVLAAGESPTGDEQGDGLEALNAMLDSWQADRMSIYFKSELTVATVAGTATYTFGTGGDNATRPDNVDYVYARDGSTDYELTELSDEQYAQISDKDSQALPDSFYFNPKMPQAELTVFPVPDKVYSLRVGTWGKLQSFATAATTVSLPSGYEDALAYSLALRLAPEYGRPASAELVALAQNTRSIIKRANVRKPLVAKNEVGAMTYQSWDISYG